MRIKLTEKDFITASFITVFEDFQIDAANINEKNGFSTDDPLFDKFEAAAREVFAGEQVCIEQYEPVFSAFRNARAALKLMLSVSELSETLEAVRKNLGPDSHCPEFSCEEVEVADAILRLMNYATDRKLRLAEAIIAKNEFNRNRADHSKEARASEHGKRF